MWWTPVEFWNPHKKTRQMKTTLHGFCKSNRFLWFWRCRLLNELDLIPNVHSKRRHCLPETKDWMHWIGGEGTARKCQEKLSALRSHCEFGSRCHDVVLSKASPHRAIMLTHQGWRPLRHQGSRHKRRGGRLSVKKGNRRKRRADTNLRVTTRGIWTLHACWSELFLHDSQQKSWAVSPTVHLSSS